MSRSDEERVSWAGERDCPWPVKLRHSWGLEQGRGWAALNRFRFAAVGLSDTGLRVFLFFAALAGEPLARVIGDSYVVSVTTSQPWRRRAPGRQPCRGLCFPSCLRSIQRKGCVRPLPSGPSARLRSRRSSRNLHQWRARAKQSRRSQHLWSRGVVYLSLFHLQHKFDPFVCCSKGAANPHPACAPTGGDV